MSEPPTVAQFRYAYSQADEFARKVTEFRASVAIPAHNELRYAGHHLLRALSDDGEPVDREQLSRAISHCERSMYEASEAGIIHALDRIEEFKRDYRDVVVSEVLVNWSQVLAVAKRTRDMLISGRDRGSPSETSAQYMEKFGELVEICDLLDGSRDDLNKKIVERKAARRRYISVFLLRSFGIVAALLAAGVATIVTFLTSSS